MQSRQEKLTFFDSKTAYEPYGKCVENHTIALQAKKYS